MHGPANPNWPRGGIGARRVVGRFLGEFMRVVKGKVTIDLIGADVVITHIVFTRRFQQAERASTLVFRNGSGLAIELSLCDSAA